MVAAGCRDLCLPTHRWTAKVRRQPPCSRGGLRRGRWLAFAFPSREGRVGRLDSGPLVVPGSCALAVAGDGRGCRMRLSLYASLAADECGMERGDAFRALGLGRLALRSFWPAVLGLEPLGPAVLAPHRIRVAPSLCKLGLGHLHKAIRQGRSNSVTGLTWASSDPTVVRRADDQ